LVIHKNICGIAVSLSELFRDPDLLMGLRGDPFMWEALEKRFLEVEMSSSTEELVSMLKTEYQAITGQPLENDNYAYVEEFAHGGMSRSLSENRHFSSNRGICQILPQAYS